jgi:hypothetical protein
LQLYTCSFPHVYVANESGVKILLYLSPLSNSTLTAVLYQVFPSITQYAQHICCPCKPNCYKFQCVGTCDYLAINHYTTFFTYQSEEDSVFLLGTGVANTPDDKYATASSGWLQVSKKRTAEFTLCTRVYVFFNLYFSHFGTQFF